MGVSVSVHYTGSTSGCPEIGSVIVGSPGGRWACLWQAAVISGAQRAEFIRLSWGCEPFRPATLQFVSHSASRTAAWMWLSRARGRPAPCPSHNASRGEVHVNSWLPRGWSLSRFCVARPLAGRKCNAVNAIWLQPASETNACWKVVRGKKTSLEIHPLQQKPWNEYSFNNQLWGFTLLNEGNYTARLLLVHVSRFFLWARKKCQISVFSLI